MRAIEKLIRTINVFWLNIESHHLFCDTSARKDNLPAVLFLLIVYLNENHTNNLKNNFYYYAIQPNALAM